MDDRAQGHQMNKMRTTFDQLAAQWRDGTHYHSNPAIIMRHPAIRSIIDMGPETIPWMLEKWRDEGGPWNYPLAIVTDVKITDGINPVTNQQGEPIPGWVGINHRTLRRAWLYWGVENGHIESTASKPQTTSAGFELRRYHTCEDVRCNEERERVYRCPSCGQSFCNTCTEIMHWEFEARTECPRCGREPTREEQAQPETRQ